MELNSWLRRALPTVIVAALLAGPSIARAQQWPQTAPGEVLVALRAQSDNWPVANKLVPNAKVLGYHPGLHVYRLKLQEGQSTEAAIAALQQRGEVAYAEPNHILHVHSVPNDANYSQQYAPAKVGMESAWPIWRPKAAVTIAIVDTGIDGTHPDLTNKMLRSGATIAGYDAMTGTAGPAADDNGHGTHCAGIAAAQVNNGFGISGIAGWDGSTGSDTTYTKLMPVKVMDKTGAGTDATVADGITWAADHGAKVISLSLGGPAVSQTLANAVAYAWSKGCVIVSSAGNDGTSALSYPAALPHVIAVAASDRNDTLAFYSNYGSWVQVAAPGGAGTRTDSIISTTPTYTANEGFPLYYGTASGTSMAGPVVAGEAALIWAQNPSLTNAQVDSLIETNVDGYLPYNGHSISTSGGRVNVFRALLAAGGQTSTQPAAPSALKATANGTNRIDLAWTDNSNNESGFKVERSTDGVAFTVIATTAANATSYSDTSVNASTGYVYRVRATNTAGDSAPSNTASATTAGSSLPAAPSSFAAGAMSRTTISIAWRDNATNETGYAVEGSSDGRSFVYLGAVGANSTRATVGGLRANTQYWFRVRAYNSAGYSAYANVASARTLR